MAGARWLGGMSVGVEAFDHSHQECFVYFDRIGSALDAGEAETADRLCGELMRMATEHAADELAFLHRHGYPSMAGVLEAQAGLKQRVDQLQRAIRQDAATAGSMLEELKVALFDYLLRGDINFKSFVEELRRSGRL
jgi:hemerythrin